MKVRAWAGTKNLNQWPLTTCSAGQLHVSKGRENIEGQLLQAGKWNFEKRNSRQSHRAAGDGAVGKQHRSNVETPQAVQMITMIMMLMRMMMTMMPCTHSRRSIGGAMWKRPRPCRWLQWSRCWQGWLGRAYTAEAGEAAGAAQEQQCGNASGRADRSSPPFPPAGGHHHFHNHQTLFSLCYNHHHCFPDHNPPIFVVAQGATHDFPLPVLPPSSTALFQVRTRAEIRFIFDAFGRTGLPSFGAYSSI